jgi:hypothetical protein
MAMVVGVVLHLIYLWGRSLWLPMLLHFLNNSLAVTVTRIPGLKELEDPAPGAEPWLLVFTAFVLLLVVLVTLYKSRARLVSIDDQPAWQPPYPGVVCPPPESNTRIVSPPVHLGLASLVMFALAGFTLALVLPFLGTR